MKGKSFKYTETNKLQVNTINQKKEGKQQKTWQDSQGKNWKNKELNKLNYSVTPWHCQLYTVFF